MECNLSMNNYFAGVNCRPPVDLAILGLTDAPTPTGVQVAGASVETMSLWDRICQLLPESWSRTASNSVQVLVTGKTGAGKSSLINGIIGDDIAKEGQLLDRSTTAVRSYSHKYQDVDITIWDSPGLQDGLDKEAEFLKDMREKCANVDLVLYCTRMDDIRLHDDDKRAIEKITKELGKGLWENAVFVLTFANRVEPPLKRAYQAEEREDPKQFFIKRMAWWMETFRKAMKNAGVDHKVVENIPFVPAGYDAVKSLPDLNDWLSPLWYASILAMKENGQPALLKANLHRIKLPDEVKPEDFRKPLHQQPLVLKSDPAKGDQAQSDQAKGDVELLEKVSRMEKIVNTLSLEMQKMKDEKRDQDSSNNETLLQQKVNEQAEQIKQLEVKLQDKETQPLPQLQAHSNQADHAERQSTTGTSQTNQVPSVNAIAQSATAPTIPDAVQRTLEKHDRELRKCNVVIVGIAEGEETTREAIEYLCTEKLKIDIPNFSTARRLGREQRDRPRPIRVTCVSEQEKFKFTSQRSKLLGSGIYINNDQTPQQQDEERLLRAACREAKDRGATATWKNGKLYIDGHPYIPPTGSEISPRLSRVTPHLPL